MRHATAIVALAAALVVADPATARPAPEVWATVNACDTTLHPNQIGIRGQMAGLPRRTRMYMRFRVQFRNSAGEWKTVKRGRLTDSRWVRVAVAKGGQYDAGWSFSFRPPAAGGAAVLRGVVAFRWFAGETLLERARAYTEVGHPGTTGADPADYSAASCEIA